MTFQRWKEWRLWEGYPARVVFGIAHRRWLIAVIQLVDRSPATEERKPLTEKE